MSNIDLVMETLGVGVSAAVKWLQDQFTEHLSKRSNSTMSPNTKRPPIDLALHHEVIDTLLPHLNLTDKGARYLESRCLNPEFAASQGDFKSIDAHEWPEIRDFLRKEFSRDELRAAGMLGFGWFSNNPKRPTLWPEPVDALVIPYFDRINRLYTVRMRCVSGSSGPKYSGMPGVLPPEPFGADYVYSQCTNRLVHLTEGELDAWTLNSEYGELALGSPGAATPKGEWFTPLASAAGIVIWGDGDEAGDRFVSAVKGHIEDRLGPNWMQERLVYRRRMPNGLDVNALHCAGLLERPLVREAA